MPKTRLYYAEVYVIFEADNEKDAKNFLYKLVNAKLPYELSIRISTMTHSEPRLYDEYEE